MNLFWALGLVCLGLGGWVDGFVDPEEWINSTEVGGFETNGVGSNVLYVPITLIPNAKGAVCMDGSPPAYHIHQGFGSGANNWLVNLEGGGWCNDVRTCNYRKKSRRGSSYYMEKQIPFTGIMSDKPEDNPDFFNWNRVKVRYCDGASFTGEGFNRQVGIFFRGQRIYQVAMEELMSKGMRYAKQALLAGCSAGGLASVQHCDEFRALFSRSTKVKCLADAGLFLDVVDVAGGRMIRSFFEGVVNMQGSGRNLPRTCTSRMDATSCFFPQNVVQSIQTPMFILNTAYDVWQSLHYQGHLLLAARMKNELIVEFVMLNIFLLMMNLELIVGVLLTIYTCENLSCSKALHTVCLRDWLRSITTTRQSFDVLFGNCPYCSDPVAVKT